MKSYRSFATIVLAILLVISPLFACGKIPKAEILKSELPAQDRLIITGQSIFQSIDPSLLQASPGSPNLLSVHATDNGIAIIWYTQNSVFISSLDLSGKVTSTILIEGVEGTPLLSNSYSGTNLLLISEVLDKESLRYKYIYYAISGSSSVITSGKIDAAQDHNLIDAVATSEFTAKIFIDNAILDLDMNTGEIISQKADNSGIYCVAYSPDGKIFALEARKNNQRTFSQINLSENTRHVIATFSPDEEIFPESIVSSSSSESRAIYLISSNSISRYIPSESKFEQLLDTAETNLMLINELTLISDDSFLVWGEYNYSYNSVEGLIEISLGNKTTDRKVLQMGVAINDSSSDPEFLAFLFNQSQSDYEIQIVYYEDYMAEQTENESFSVFISNARNKMLLDVLGESPPDLFYLPVGELSNLADSDILMNIAPIIDSAIDNEPDTFATNALTATREGESQYFLTPFVSVSGFIIYESHLSEIDDFTLDGFKIYADSFQLSLFGDIYKHSFSDIAQFFFIDRENGISHFDSDELRSIFNSFSLSSDTMKRERLLKFDTFSNIDYYVQTAEMMSENFAVIGYPLGERTPAVLSASMGFGVHKNTYYPDGGKAYIDFLLSDIAQNMGEALSMGELPVRLSALDSVLNSFQANRYEESLNTITSHGSTSSDSADAILRPYPPDGSWESQFREIILSADGFYIQDWFIYAIVEEELQHYLFGEKSADETAEIIHSRISNYLAETIN